MQDVTVQGSDTTILDCVQLRVLPGVVYGMVGSAGSGKTTLLHVVLGLQRWTSGTVRVLGSSNPARVRRRVGYVPGVNGYHLRYRAREYLRYLGTFSNLHGAALRRAIDEQLATVGLLEVANLPLMSYTRGMLQRLGIAQALLTNPALLLIDDPLATLDPHEQRDVLAAIQTVAVPNRTILLTSSYHAGLATVCQHVGILHEGRLVAESPTSALHRASGQVLILVDRLSPVVRAMLQGLSPAIACYDNGLTIAPNSTALQARVLRILLDYGVTILALEPLQHPLEQFYQQATGQPPTAMPVRVVARPAASPPAQPPTSPPTPQVPAGAPVDPLLDTLLRSVRDGEPDPQSATAAKGQPE